MAWSCQKSWNFFNKEQQIILTTMLWWAPLAWEIINYILSNNTENWEAITPMTEKHLDKANAKRYINQPTKTHKPKTGSMQNLYIYTTKHHSMQPQQEYHDQQQLKHTKKYLHTLENINDEEAKQRKPTHQNRKQQYAEHCTKHWRRRLRKINCLYSGYHGGQELHIWTGKIMRWRSA